MLKNPKQIASIVRNKTFIVLNNLTPPSEEDKNEPLNFHHNRFSRFSIVIINENKKPTTANIVIKDMIAVIDKSRFLQEKEMEQMLYPQKDDSLAYTVRLTSGNLKGKTPAEVMNEFPDGKEQLNRQYLFLKNHLAQYPKNKIQMDAISEASQLFCDGKLEKQNSIPTFCIIDSGFRPLRRTKPNGKRFVYQYRIDWIFGAKNPVNICIENYYANVVEVEGGLLNVQKKEDVEDYIKNQMSFSLDEWLYIIHQVETNINTFEFLHARDLYRSAENAEKEKRHNFTR